MDGSALAKLAKLVVKYSTEVEPGDEVVIQCNLECVSLVYEIYREVLEAGGYPSVYFSDEVLSEIFYRYASEKQLTHISPLSRAYVEHANVFINIFAPRHTRSMSSVDPEKIKLATASRSELLKTLMAREAKGELRWVVVPYPTMALAQEASMSYLEYRDFVFKACKLYSDDPVKVWSMIHEEQERIVEVLSRIKELRIVGEKTDLTLSVEGRRWINASGKKNMPDGEIFTSPVEDSAEGTIHFEYPAIHRGVEIRGVRLKLKEGRIVEADAEEGRDFLKKMLEADEGASRLGEVAFGTNYDIDRFTRSILFDEKIGGTVHLAVGRGFPEAGGRNFSTVHIDLIKDMKRGKVYGDGELIYEGGKFKI